MAFSSLMAQRGWLVITGAGDGIMKAGHEGPGAEGSFGLAIRLPFETTANSVIAGDSKLMHFRYFFTRKLMFLSQARRSRHSRADWISGRTARGPDADPDRQVGDRPVVLIEGADSDYWQQWEAYVREEFLKGGFISPEDTSLYHLARDPQDAADHVTRFYANYHSSRYVRWTLVIRIRRPLTDGQLVRLNMDFARLVRTGSAASGSGRHLSVEGEFLDLPRIAFHHTRRSFGTVRRLIDRLNDYALDG